MSEFRACVAPFLVGKSSAPLIASQDGQGRPTLRRGDRGDSVKQLQQLLKLTPDGSFGPQTEAALRDWQRAHNLVPDGIAGPTTWAALDAACK